MSNIFRKNSLTTYREDIFKSKLSYIDLKKLDQKIFADEIPNEFEAFELLNKLKELKKSIKERIANLHNNKNLETKENQNYKNENKVSEKKENIEKHVNTNKSSFVQLYKRHLKLKEYKDISPINILTNSNTKIRSVVAFFAISKENLTLRIENILEEGRKHINVLLMHERIKEENNKKNKEQHMEHNKELYKENQKVNWQQEKEKQEVEEENSGVIFSYDTQNDEEDIFNITQANNLINTINLEIMDSRDIALIIKDVVIGMVRIIEEKFDKRDKNGLDFGITHRILNEILKIKKPEKTFIRKKKSDTSNKEADSVQSEKGGYEDDLDLDYDDEDKY